MAQSLLKTDSEIGQARYRVALEEFDLSSFGDSLAPAELLDVTDSGVLLLESGEDFPSGTLMRVDLYPQGSRNGGGDSEFTLCGSVSESREIISGEIYRVFIVLQILENESYRAILKEIQAI